MPKKTMFQLILEERAIYQKDLLEMLAINNKHKPKRKKDPCSLINVLLFIYIFIKIIANKLKI
jgi:hypothetical protein